MQRLLALGLYDMEQAKCSCGRQFGECHDPATVWYPQRAICYATRDQMAAQAKYAAVHDEEHQFHDGTETHWSAKRSDAHPFHYDAGVSIYVTTVDHDPDGEFLVAPQRRSATTVKRGAAEQDETLQLHDDRMGG